MESSTPAYPDVASLPTTLSRGIPDSFEDANGHMNVRYHLDLTVHAVATMLRQVGLTDDYRTRTGCGSFALEHHLNYFAEVLVGHDVTAHLKLFERSPKVVHGMVFLLDRTSERLASTLEFTVAHIDLGTRRVSVWPVNIADAIDRLVADAAGLGWRAPVTRGMGVRRS